MSDHRFNHPAELDAALAEDITHQLETAIGARGHASLVVSGGSTPKGLFARLAAAPLPWDKITVLLADERWVPSDHDDSNERMVRQVLLQGAAAAATFISLIPEYPNQEKNLQTVNGQLQALGAFDVVILGMGSDMHTASLFPCSAEVQTGLFTTDPALMIHPATAPHARISLSRTRLEATHAGYIHIVGEDKWQVLSAARDIGEEAAAPISVFAEPKGVFAVWYAPKA